MIQFCLKAEALKERRSLSRKLVILMPAVLVLISLLMMYAGIGLGAFSNLLVCNWCVPMGSLTVSLFCYLSNRRERICQYRTICSLPIDLKNLYFAKMGLAALKLLEISLILAALSLSASWIDLRHFPGIRQAGAYGVGFVLLWLSLLWQIPLCLLLTQKLGFAGSLLLNLLASGIGGLFFSATPLFWMMPYSWTARVMTRFFGVLPSGLAAGGAGGGFAWGECGLIVALSLVSAILFAVLFGGRLERRVTGKC